MTTTVRVRIPSYVAVLSALEDGTTTIAEIAKGAKMTNGAVTQVLRRLAHKEPPQVQRTNKRGFATIAEYKITRAGKAALKEVKKKAGIA